MRLRYHRRSEGTTARDPVQHKRWTYTCYSAVNTEHQQRWKRWWCTTPIKHLTKVTNRGTTILMVHKFCTPINKLISKISNCCHYFILHKGSVTILKVHKCCSPVNEAMWGTSYPCIYGLHFRICCVFWITVLCTSSARGFARINILLCWYVNNITTMIMTACSRN